MSLLELSCCLNCGEPLSTPEEMGNGIIVDGDMKCEVCSIFFRIEPGGFPKELEITAWK